MKISFRDEASSFERHESIADNHASLSVTQDGDRVLIHCHAGCAPEAVCGAVHLTLADLYTAKPTRNGQAKRIVAAYDYRDETGALLYQVCRFDPKDFRARRPDPAKPSGWLWNLKGVRRVPFRLPELIAAVPEGHPIFVVEGEKDALAIIGVGFAATCNAGGVGKWQSGFSQYFKGAEVIVISDRDKPGRKHAGEVARSLHGKAASVRVLELPDRDGKPVKDAHDWITAGGTADELRALVDAAPVFDPVPISGTTPNGESKPGEDEQEGAPPNGDSGNGGGNVSAATLLVRLAEHFEFFHDSQRRGFAQVEVNGHVEVWPVKSSQLKFLLAQMYYEHTGSAVNRNALADALDTLQGQALFKGEERPVYLRVAPDGDNILIDLCDKKWRVVKVTPDGWEIMDKSPVAFIRTGSMRPLPEPAGTQEGSLQPLWDLLNVPEAQRPLVAGALLNRFHPHGPYFVVNYIGEQGTGKSCAARMDRQLIDPNETPLRSPPREDRDLLVQAASNWVVALDNLSKLPQWLSDGICRLATGGGHSARSLYTDAEEFTLSVKRPVILNGIEDVAIRPDLAERALQIELETIPDAKRRSERELWQRFEAARPIIFSAILNGLCRALRDMHHVSVSDLPRMADGVLWATAGEPGLGFERGSFEKAYRRNLSEGAVASVEAHSVGNAIIELLQIKPEWSGEPAQLLKALTELPSGTVGRSDDWPKNARSLSGILHRLAPAFRKFGVNLTFGFTGSGADKRRQISLKRNGCKSASPASPAEPVADGRDGRDGRDATKQPSRDGQGSPS